ncbi:MAG: HrpE/YscL family type III secretion apparatus protein [Chlamydiia bacterium]|nr:HrpE/YscL family type III secretion apparatus protein [Chlamydiia bacterium]
MSKKLFTLIRNEELRLAPGAKILKAEDYATLLSSEEMLETVKNDAEEYRLQVAKEAEKVKEEAEHEGFEEGMRQWSEHILKLEKQIENVHGELSKLIIPVALKAAKKIIGHEIETNQKTVVDIIINNLKAVAHHKRIKIYVNRDDLAVIENSKEALKKVFEQLESLLIIESEDVKPGGTIIETEGGIINAQLENLLRTLEKAFESYMEQDAQHEKSH